MLARLANGLFNQPYQLWMAIVLLVVAGLSALMSLPRLEDPRLLNRFPTVETAVPGATPEQVEALVSEPIEEVLRQVPQVAVIESTSATGLSVISVELDDTVTAQNQNEILAQLREKLDSAVLPANAGLPDLSTDGGGAGAYTLLLAVTGPETDWFDPIAMGRYAEDVANRLRQLSGTEYVTTIGGVDEQIQVSVDAQGLNEIGLSLAQLARLVDQADVQGGSGVLRQSEQQLTLNMQGGFEDVQRIRNIPIRVEQGRTLRLGDLAQVSRGWQDPTETLSYFNNRPNVIVAARVNPQARVDFWTASAIESAQGIAAPEGFDLEVLFEQRQYTETRLAELSANLLFGALLVFFVVLAFMGWRAALVVGVALPLTFSGVLFGLNLLGIQIHQMSVFGMIIALGLLIDNAIVMVDEVRVRIHQGKSPADALQGSINYLSGPLFASTLTTVLGFAPILLLSGAIGDFIGAIAVSVTLALIVSFGLSMTVIPALAARYPGGNDRGGFWQRGIAIPWLARAFAKLLTLTTRWTPMGIVLGMIPGLAGFALVGTLGMQFFPAADRDHFEVKVTFAPSQTLAQTQRAYETAYQAIEREIQPLSQSWVLGQSHPAVYYNQIPDQKRNDAYMQGVLTFADADRSRAAIDQVQALLDTELPGARVVVLPFGQGPPVAYPLAFRLFGPDLDELSRLGVEMRQALQAHPQVLHTAATINQDAIRLGFQPDEDRIRALGLSLSDVSLELLGATEGLPGGTLMEGPDQMPISVRYQPSDRASLVDLDAVRIQAGADSVPLSALGEWRLEPEPASISRYNGERLNTIGGWLTTGALALEVTADVQAALEAIELPPGYRMEIAGESEEQANSVGALAAYLPVLLVGIIATLILSFQSIRIAGVIVFVGIFSVGSGLLALVFSGFPLGFNPILGTAGLMGVAINGSIVVLAAIQEDPRARQGKVDALVNAAMGCTRHILSTTLTTMGGFLPLMLGGGLFWPPLAVVIAGGVGFSVLLALVLTPALYRVVMWYRPKLNAAPDLA